MLDLLGLRRWKKKSGITQKRQDARLLGGEGGSRSEERILLGWLQLRVDFQRQQYN